MQDSSFYSSLSLAKHFSALCGIAVSLVDARDRALLFSHCEKKDFFCTHCPNHCRLLSTMLYGCNEARRWQGRYTFYCPIGLVFTAVSIPSTDSAMIAGPVVMGELQDTLMELPEQIDRTRIQELCHCSAQQLRHMSSVLELAVCGLRHRPNAAYDTNALPSEDTQEVFICAYLRQLEEPLRQAIRRQDKSRAREILNQLLRYVYSPHPDQIDLIRDRAVELVHLLVTIGDPGTFDVYMSIHLPALRQAALLEQIDETLARMLHLYVDYAFDFNEIRHSDTIYRAMEYIKSNYSRKISLEEIASYAHLSSSHLSETFHKETGQKLSAYINHVRIEKSKQLLRSSQIPIAEISFLCGFEDQSYFSRVFRQITGCSPRKYRDNYSQE